MKTHNFYADLLISLRTFFDRCVFPNDEIKGYRFNIGNRSLQLNYETKFDLPWMMIEYQTSRPIAYQSHTWLKSHFDNISKYPVLFNKTKNLTLMMQEELFEFTIQATVNCESQLQALSYQRAIDEYLVHNRYFQLYSFFSFFTIDDYLLHDSMFDIHNDQIYNLFLRHDVLKNDSVYSFSVKYEPLIRMESSDASIGTSEQRSFPITMSLTIINPLPIYVEIPIEERAKPSLTKTFTQSDVYIPLDTRYSIVKVDVLCDDGSGYVIPSIVYDEVKFDVPLNYRKLNIYDDDSEFDFEGNLSGTISKEKSLGTFKTIIDDLNYELDYELYEDVNDDVRMLRLFGPVTGVVVQLKDMTQFGPSYVSGWFNGVIDGTPKKLAIEGELEEFARTIILSDHMVRIDNSTKLVRKYTVSPQPFGNLRTLITDFNARLLSLDIKSTYVTELLFFYDLRSYTIPVVIAFDDAGNFKHSFEYTLADIKLRGCVYGKLNPKQMTFDVGIHINDEAFKLVSVKCDFVFHSHVGFGGAIIDKINLNITDDITPVSSTVGSASYFKDDFIEIEQVDNKRLVQNVILQDSQQEHFVIPIDDSNDVKIKINLASGFDFNDISDSAYWRFYLNSNSHIIDSNTDGIHLIERTDDDSPNIIYFYCIESIYNTFFRDQINIDNPIFFQLYKLKRG